MLDATIANPGGALAGPCTFFLLFGDLEAGAVRAGASAAVAFED